jgi:methyl-accepting chemotaxis protein
MASSDSKIAKIQTHFQTLSSVATSLNTASDELTRVVGVLDEALKKLNVGLTVWVTFSQWSDEYDEGITQINRYIHEQIGYCKVNGKWGIALRRMSVDDAGPDESVPWLFNDAPREMRLEAVDKIPQVIEELSKEASKTTKIVQEKTNQLLELAAVIEQVAKPPLMKLTATEAATLKTISDAIAKAKEGSE